MSIIPDLPPIEPLPNPVTIATSVLPQGNIGLPYSVNINAYGGYPPYTWSLVSGSLPGGLTISSGGKITGTPIGPIGSYTFVVKVVDSILGEDNKTLSIVIATPTSPIITTNSLPTATIGSPYSQTITAVGGVTPYTWSIAGGSLPVGITLNPTSGILSGTPTIPGVYNFTVNVTDSQPESDDQAYQLIVKSLSPVIVTIGIPNGMTNVPYTTTILAYGGTTPYVNWQVIAGSLPTGLTLTGSPTNAVISGTPTQSGSFTFTVEVTDSASSTDTQVYNLIIANGNVPTIYTTFLPFATNGVLYSASINASGGSLPYTWSILSGNLPPGLSIDSNTGSISGTPTTNGSYVFFAKVEDANHNVDVKLFTIVVGNFILPAIITPSLSNGAVGYVYSDYVQADGGLLPYAWGVIGSLPTGLTINPTTGEISGTPSVSGVYTFQIVVLDSSLNTDIKSYTVEIGTGSVPIITTGYVKDGYLDVPYNKSLMAVGGTPGYTWILQSGILPPGITITPSGILSGIPSVFGIFNFTVRVTDAINQSAYKTYKLVIKSSGFDSGCCFCVFTDDVINFTNNADGILTATGGTIISNISWRAPSEPGICIITYSIFGENGIKVIQNQIKVIRRLIAINVDNNIISHLLPGETFQIETNYPQEDVQWMVLDDGPKLVTPIGNVIINSSPADQCFGAVDRTIRGYVAEDNCTGFLNNVDIKIKVNPVYPTPDNCGPMINKWLREGKEFNTLKIEYAGGCDETHLKNRVPIIKWSINYDGLTKYRTEETQCPLCNTCIIFCGCEDKVQPIYTEGCHPILQSANRLDDFWNLVYGQYKSFTLIDYDTGEVWYNVKFNDDMKYDHRHRIWSQSRTVSLIWRPCCANYPVGGTCSTHGMMNFKPKRDDCIKKKECEG